MKKTRLHQVFEKYLSKKSSKIDYNSASNFPER
jgi:hypothetical protein